jgi:hypothetical protein
VMGVPHRWLIAARREQAMSGTSPRHSMVFKMTQPYRSGIVLIKAT